MSVMSGIIVNFALIKNNFGNGKRAERFDQAIGKLFAVV